ncbi:MAG: hypothetical protein ACJAZN_001327 [Planctomycetota bacterium]|jgi:hypothetical protein
MTSPTGHFAESELLQRLPQHPNHSAHEPLPRSRLAVLRPLWCMGLALCAALWPASCGAVAINNPELMSDDQFQKGAQVIDYDHGADYVWVHVKETLAHLSSRQPEFNDASRRAFATVEAGSIQIGVIALGESRCRMAVRARRYGLPSDELATGVLDRIHEEIEP